MLRSHAEALDAADPLARKRGQFYRPEGVIYLDGNSLGMLPLAARAAVDRAVTAEWGEGLIRSWNSAGWIDKPRQLGDRIGRLIGAGHGQTIVADSTSVNLFKALIAALRLNPDRKVVVSEEGNFPSDLYIAQGVQGLMPDIELRLIPEGERDAAAYIDDRVAVVMLTHIDFKTAHMHDMAAVTEATRAAGAISLWDLAHSAGAVPVDLDGVGADLAVGCTYKYLNAGPGGPAFLYCARRHQEQAAQPLTGWLGHRRPFDFTLDYEAGNGIDRFVCGTPPILSFTALEGALTVFDDVSMADLREKSLRLTDLFIELVDTRLGDAGFSLVTPKEHSLRGSHVSLGHPQGYGMMQALIDHGVIGDFRAPDLLRFGFTPLTLSYADVWDAVDRWRRILDQELWLQEKYAKRSRVT